MAENYDKEEEERNINGEITKDYHLEIDGECCQCEDVK